MHVTARVAATKQKPTGISTLRVHHTPEVSAPVGTCGMPQVSPNLLASHSADRSPALQAVFCSSPSLRGLQLACVQVWPAITPPD